MSSFAKHCAVVSPAIGLACAFPPAMGLNGATTTIGDLSRHGLVRPLWTPNKAAAVRLITDRNMEQAENSGHGNKAKRRMENL